MTNRLTFGVDPGLSGAIATLIDGEPGPIIDMPTMDDGHGHNEVDALAIRRFVAELMTAHPGAYISACIERVRAMPNKQKPGEAPRTMGAQSSFNFGDGFGQVKAVFRVMRIPTTLVEAMSWKRKFGLIGKGKDEARLLAIARFPSIADQLKRKKDGGRADSLLLALYHEHTANGLPVAV